MEALCPLPPFTSLIHIIYGLNILKFWSKYIPSKIKKLTKGRKPGFGWFHSGLELWMTFNWDAVWERHFKFFHFLLSQRLDSNHCTEYKSNTCTQFVEATGFSSPQKQSAARGPRILPGLVSTHFLARFDLLHFLVLFTSRRTQLKGGPLQPSLADSQVKLSCNFRADAWSYWELYAKRAYSRQKQNCLWWFGN